MIVVDSSVWIAQLRGERTPATQLLHTAIADDDVLIGDLILLELLQGARDDAHAARIEAVMGPFPIVPMLDVAVATEAARNYRRLRGRGITIRKTNDLIIGTFCIHSGHVLLHTDRDFDPMVAHLGLRVAVI